MLNGLGGRRLYVCHRPVDLRKGFDGLSALVRSGFCREPQDGSAYVFFNRRRTQAKILFWEPGGYWLCGKRLEAGTFSSLKGVNGGILELSQARLGMLMEGLEAPRLVMRKRYTEKVDLAA